MKVKTLIGLLEELDEDAEIVVKHYDSDGTDYQLWEEESIIGLRPSDGKYALYYSQLPDLLNDDFIWIDSKY